MNKLLLVVLVVIKVAYDVTVEFDGIYGGSKKKKTTGGGRYRQGLYVYLYRPWIQVLKLIRKNGTSGLELSCVGIYTSKITTTDKSMHIVWKNVNIMRSFQTAPGDEFFFDAACQVILRFDFTVYNKSLKVKVLM